MTNQIERAKLIEHLKVVANRSIGFRKEPDRADRLMISRGTVLDALATLTNEAAPAGEASPTTDTASRLYRETGSSPSSGGRDAIQEAGRQEETPASTLAPQTTPDADPSDEQWAKMVERAPKPKGPLTPIPATPGVGALVEALTALKTCVSPTWYLVLDQTIAALNPVTNEGEG